MLLDTIKARIKVAMLARNDQEKNILRVVLGESQLLESRQGSITDEQVQKVIRKIIEGNTEAIGHLKDDAQKTTLQGEIAILNTLLPKQLSFTEVEAFFLNSDKPEFEQIRDAKSDGQATGIAMKALKAAGLAVDGKVVGEVVKKIRAES